MKYLKHFSKYSLYEAYLIGSEFPETEGKSTVSFCKLQNEVHYNQYILPVPQFLDILYTNTNGEKKFDSNILDPSLGYTPIGLCVASTGFFGENEPARFISLKFMNYTTPETGSTENQYMYHGNYGIDITTIDNIQTVYNGGSIWGYLTADWITDTENKIPDLFDINNEWNISVLGTVNAYVVTDIDGKNKTDKILAEATAQTTWRTDLSIDNQLEEGYTPGACCCWKYHTLGTQQGDWYLPACGEIAILAVKRNEINTKLAAINTLYPNDCIDGLHYNHFLTSTECNNERMYYVDTNTGKISTYTKSYYYMSVIAMIQY